MIYWHHGPKELYLHLGAASGRLSWFSFSPLKAYLYKVSICKKGIHVGFLMVL